MHAERYDEWWEAPEGETVEVSPHLHGDAMIRLPWGVLLVSVEAGEELLQSQGVAEK